MPEKKETMLTAVPLFRNENKTKNSMVDYEKFEITFCEIVNILTKGCLDRQKLEQQSIALFDGLFSDIFESDFARNMVEIDSDNKSDLVIRPYRQRKNGKGEITVGAWDNLKDILEFIITYFGVSFSNLSAFYERCYRLIIESDLYDAEWCIKHYSGKIQEFQTELNKLIDSRKKTYQAIRQVDEDESEEAQRIHARIEHLKKLRDYWGCFFDLTDDTDHYNKAIAHLILFSIININVIFLNFEASLPFRTTRVSQIQEGKKYILSSYMNPNLYLGSLLTDHLLDTENEEYSGLKRRLLCTKLNEGALIKEDIVLEFEPVKKAENGEYYCKIKSGDYYLRADGLFKRSYLEFVKNPKGKKADKTIWKIEFSESEDDPYITVRSAAPLPAKVFCIDIPNGNYRVNNLLLWLFITNGSNSQKFYLHEIEDDAE